MKITMLTPTRCELAAENETEQAFIDALDMNRAPRIELRRVPYPERPKVWMNGSVVIEAHRAPPDLIDEAIREAVGAVGNLASLLAADPARHRVPTADAADPKA